MRSLYVVAFLLLAGRAQSQPLWPILTPSPGDTLLVFERLASREGLRPEELSFRIHSCLPDGRILPAPAMAIDPKYFSADRDSLVRVAMEQQGKSGPFAAIEQTLELGLNEAGDASYFSAERSCYNLSHERWIAFRSRALGGILLYDPRTGATSVHDTGPWPPHLLPDNGEPPIGWSYGSERNNFGLSARRLDGSGRLAGGIGFEPASYFFLPAPGQSAVILVYNYYGPTEMDEDDRRKSGRPLSLLRFDRASSSLPEVATLPPCKNVLGVTVDAAGGILVAGEFREGLRLFRIDTLRGFALSWTMDLPAKGRFPDWYLSNASCGRVLVGSQPRGPERRESADVRLLDCQRLAPVCSAMLPAPDSMSLGGLRLAGNRMLVQWSRPRPMAPEADGFDFDVRWDLYTIAEGDIGLALIPDHASVEFMSRGPDRHLTYGEPSILAAVDGLGFLNWRGDSLAWLH